MKPSQKGFSLIQVLVALGITGVISMVVMQLSRETMRTQKRAEVSSDV